jgi:hypothetical protein
MKEYPQPGGTLHEEGQATKFMPFAGTEGYNRSPTPHTFWRQPSEICSGLIFRTCCC